MRRLASTSLMPVKMRLRSRGDATSMLIWSPDLRPIVIVLSERKARSISRVGVRQLTRLRYMSMLERLYRLSTK